MPIYDNHASRNHWSHRLIEAVQVIMDFNSACDKVEGQLCRLGSELGDRALVCERRRSCSVPHTSGMWIAPG